MTFVNEMIAEAREPDSLEKIIDSMRGVIELAESMLPIPTSEHIHLLIMDLLSVEGRLFDYRKNVIWKVQDDSPQ